MALGAQSVGGCYSYSRLDPTGGVPGQDVTAEISDRGRVALGTSLGPSPFRVSGRLTGVTDSTLTLAVREVESLRGSTAPWTGEVITLGRAGVTGVQARRLDRTRTALVAVSFVAAVAAFVATRSLTSSGRASPPSGTNPPPSPPSS